MSDNKFESDDRLSQPPTGAQVIKKKDSWEILLSDSKRLIYIVSTDYHPEPLQLNLREVREIRRHMKSDNVKREKPKKVRKKKK